VNGNIQLLGAAFLALISIKLFIEKEIYHSTWDKKGGIDTINPLLADYC
jgi:hypothetical protein